MSGVTLLGAPAAMDWHQTTNGLELTLPKIPPCQFAWGLKVTGQNLKAVSIH